MRMPDRSYSMTKNEALRLVSKAMDEVKYGEITIKMQDGLPLFVEQHIRHRVVARKEERVHEQR